MMVKTISPYLLILFLFSCSGQNDLAEYLKKEKEHLEAENKALKLENETLKLRVSDLEKELDRLKKVQPPSASTGQSAITRPKPATHVRTSDLVGKWQARLKFKERTSSHCGDTNEVLVQNWQFTIMSGGSFHIRANDRDIGDFQAIALDDNKLNGENSNAKFSLYVKNKDLMTGEVSEGRGCVVKYSITLTRIKAE